ncbi:cAMP-dependent protein kinase regulatory subunit [Grifola frondosa]|uniref:cAMP-dependent protein kinase regulatory subunit n=1 Tax=Grifola frondosa TaxID=5627 RepID=A0A1C7MPX7_GRIFR|nr:cAMP-dependent protein kinase regulatory subunit [Grifola frondosa]
MRHKANNFTLSSTQKVFAVLGAKARHHRVQPRDALQYCANWFQTRLEEQRNRTREALSHRPSFAANLPTDHYLDSPLSPTAGGVGPTSMLPFTQSFQKQRSSLRNSMSNPSPFGTLNVPGNALLENEGGRNAIPVSPPAFRLDGDEPPPSTPIGAPNPFASFANGSISPSPGDYLHPPTAGILARRTSTADQLRRIRASIANNFIFRDLDEEQEMNVLNAMDERRVVAGEVVIRQGAVGDYFFVVEEGLLHCYIRPQPLPSSWFTPGSTLSPSERFDEPGYHPEFGKKVAECGEGSSFGELALMYGHPRAATVVAIEPSTLWALHRVTFRTIILTAAFQRRDMYERFLASVPILTSLGKEERSKIADALQSKVYQDGQAVVTQGEPGDTFFFIEEGEAVVTKRQRTDSGETKEVKVGHLTKGNYFGELSLLRLEPRAATVSAIARTDPSMPRLKVAALDAEAFTRLLGPLREIMERNAGQSYGIRPRVTR